MKLSHAALRPLLAARALPLVGAAWGVTARKSSHNAASNARGVTAGKMGRNSSNHKGSEF